MVAGFPRYQSTPGKVANKNKLKLIAGTDFQTIGWQVLKLSCMPVLHSFCHHAHVYSALWVAPFLLLVDKCGNDWFHGGIISIRQGMCGSVSQPDLSNRV